MFRVLLFSLLLFIPLSFYTYGQGVDPVLGGDSKCSKAFKKSGRTFSTLKAQTGERLYQAVDFVGRHVAPTVRRVTESSAVRRVTESSAVRRVAESSAVRRVTESSAVRRVAESPTMRQVVDRLSNQTKDSSEAGKQSKSNLYSFDEVVRIIGTHNKKASSKEDKVETLSAYTKLRATDPRLPSETTLRKQFKEFAQTNNIDDASMSDVLFSKVQIYSLVGQMHVEASQNQEVGSTAE